MKNKKLLAFRNVLMKLLVHFSIIFSMFSIMDIMIGSIIGNSISSLLMWGVILLFSAVISIIMYFIFKINKISIFAQITIAYVIIAFGSYLQGYLIRIFSFHDKMFLLISLGISLLGFLVLTTILLIKNKNENDNLNRELEEFKERDYK